MNKTMTCIACPRGCLLRVSGSADDIAVSGNCCPKGIDYGRQEVLQPLRMLTTTVRTIDTDFPRLPVRLSAEVPKEIIYECMKIINRLTIDRSVKPGDVLIEDLCSTGADLIASGGYNNER